MWLLPASPCFPSGLCPSASLCSGHSAFTVLNLLFPQAVPSPWKLPRLPLHSCYASFSSQLIVFLSLGAGGEPSRVGQVSQPRKFRHTWHVFPSLTVHFQFSVSLQIVSPGSAGPVFFLFSAVPQPWASPMAGIEQMILFLFCFYILFIYS